MTYKEAPLSFAIALCVGGTAACLSGSAFAQQPAPEVTEVRVTALGVDESADLIVAPFNVVNSDELLSRGGTLGDLLDGFPGVHADSFGAGSSRPVIRGQTTPRTKILSDGNTILDTSEVSPDHAITIDALLATQVEVLRGPATLLYGGGAIGGVVNVLDNKIPTAIPGADGGKDYDGFIALRGNTVADERAGAISLTGRATDKFAVHFESSMLRKDDYQVPNWEESHVDGTFADSKNTSLGGSWVGERGYIGLAYTYRKDEYGIPGHGEEYRNCLSQGSTLDCGDHEDNDDEHDEHDEHDETPYIDLTSKRFDLRGEYEDPMSGINKVRFRASRTDYEHFEIEGDEVESAFFNEGYETRVELDHKPVMGWQGLIGVQHSDTQFSSDGEIQFIPTVDSRSTGVFVVEHYQLTDDWHLEAGARYDWQSHRPINDARPSYSDTAISYSGAAIWNVTDGIILSATYAHAQRLPHAQELYAHGVHVATNTFECGLIAHPLTCGGADNNQTIRKETAHNFELGLRKVDGTVTYGFSVFRNNVDNYIYARTLDRYEDFRLVKYTQRDAQFTGYEAELGYQFTDTLSATMFSDYVRVGLKSTGDRLPRIPPRRFGGRINAEMFGGANVELEYYTTSAQRRIASYETDTDGYKMLNLAASYSFGNTEQYNLFLRGTNLLDEEVRNHSSFLADVIPMPGRNLNAGFRLNF